jgi:hypothetical protein
MGLDRLVRIFYSSDSSGGGGNTNNKGDRGGNQASKSPDNDYNTNLTDKVNKNITVYPGDEYALPAGSSRGPLPRSLFYDYDGDDGSGVFNYYAVGSGKSYVSSEKRERVNDISSKESRNPTAQKIIEITTSSGNFMDVNSDYVGQPYNVKDFVFSKYYGIIPNNRMLTLRRFPTPVFDNLALRVPGTYPIIESLGSKEKVNMKEGPGIDNKKLMQTPEIHTPICQAVSYFGTETGNDLNSIIGFSTGLKWDTKTQKDTKIAAKESDPGITTFLNDYTADVLDNDLKGLLNGASNVVGNFMDDGVAEKMFANTFFENLTKENGPLSEKIFVDLNTVDSVLVRGRGIVGGFTGFNVKFEYNLTSIGDMNSKILFMDLLANLLALGTDYGRFLTPFVVDEPQRQGIPFPGGPEGYIKFLEDPSKYLIEIFKKGRNPAIEAKNKQTADKIVGGISTLISILDNPELILKPGNEGAHKAVNRFLSQKMLNHLFYEPIIYSGHPTGDWHLVVGNPLNPIAMIGNLVCKSVKIDFNSVLGPDDFPTQMTATYELAHARQRHRGDFESMFNRGKGRLYLGRLPVTGQAQNQIVTAITGKDITTIDTNNLNQANLQNTIGNYAAGSGGGSAPLTTE